MRIAQIAPLFASVPPRRYGGTERVVDHLTEGLVDLGHDVTLFASGDSRTSARLVGVGTRAIGTDASCSNALAWHTRELEELMRRDRSFDIVHFHLDGLHLPVAQRLAVPSLTTLHGRLDRPESKLLTHFAGHPFVAISGAQREPLPEVRWAGVIAHGLPRRLYEPNFQTGTHLAFVGRAAPEKGLDRAIRIARTVGVHLKAAVRVDDHERGWFEETVRQALAIEVTFTGELDDAGKQQLLAGASALLFPVEWPEPFGLVMIEALACGTPVIAFRRGSVPKVIADGRTGYIVDDEAGAAAAIGRIGELRRESCRAEFEARFTSERMAADYVELYERLARSGATAKHRGA